MKKIFLALLLVSMAVVPSLVIAQAATPVSVDQSTLIAQLQAMIQQLLAQINALMAAQGGYGTTTPPVYNPLDPVITGVAGPASLAVGQQGTWKVSVTAPADAYLEYSVDWGDGLPVPVPSPAFSLASVSNQSTFSHSYANAGTYTATFSVVNNNQKGGGNPVKTTMTVTVGNVSTTGGTAYIEGTPYVSYLMALPSPLPGGNSGAVVTIRATGTLNSKGGDSYVNADWAGLGFHAVNTQGRDIPNTASQLTVVNAPKVTDSRGSLFYVLKQGVPASFTRNISYYANQMFAGTYYGQLDNLYYYGNLNDMARGAPGVQVPAGPYRSSTFYITGEQGPYITSTNYVVGKDAAVILGERLQNALVYFNGNLVSKENYTYWTSGQISFILPTYQTGSYPVYVVNSAGLKSNTVYLQVGGDTTADQLRAQINSLYGQISQSCTTPVPVPTPLPTTATIAQLQAMIATLQGILAKCQATTITVGRNDSYPISSTVQGGGPRTDIYNIGITGNQNTSLSRLDLRFDKRPWLYIDEVDLFMVRNNGEQVLLKGKNIYSISDFTEVTPGSDYLLRFDGLNTQINKGDFDVIFVEVFGRRQTDQPSTNIGITVKAGGVRFIDSQGYTSTAPINDLPQAVFAFSPSVTSTPAPTLVNGACGSANGTAVTATPNSNLCAVGTASSVMGSSGLYSWICSGLNGGASASCSAHYATTVTPVPPTPTPTQILTPTPSIQIVNFGATPATITAGQSTTLSWFVNPITTPCNIGMAVPNPYTVKPTQTTTYTLSCLDSATGKWLTKTTTVTVNATQSSAQLNLMGNILQGMSNILNGLK